MTHPTKPSVLPDISLSESSPRLSALTWVGMKGIDLPLTIVEPGWHRELHACADVQVNLPAPHIKGIHMSRLHRLLDAMGKGQGLTAVGIHQVLKAMIESHADCQSKNARLQLNFNLLLRRQALVTEDLSGWKSYPITIKASLMSGQFHCRMQVKVVYSSTCPCSAALARQLIEEAFLAEFTKQPSLDKHQVAEWIRHNASAATPHSQRSQAHVTVDVNEASSSLGMLALIDCIEQALGTPVQTAVKRADEQAFAALNGQNLMFVEDAARRIKASLQGYDHPEIFVRHLESLHPHDAVAWSSPEIGLCSI
ncbi:MAG: GTP cyclohydrolase I FolE2 [Betaproteobacteria bacterium]|nr:GTP cyclohydrolase I FolE2 [Betaproteobacteria bacterium]